MPDNDINLAALWVPVMAETSRLKGQLVKAGTEGAAATAVAIKATFAESGLFKDLGRQLNASLTSGIPDAQRAGSKLADSFLMGFQKVNPKIALAVAGIAGFGAAVVKSTDAAGDFQEKLIKLTASADETQAGLKVVHDGILQLAGQVGYSANELADGMYLIEKAGYRGAEGMEVLRAGAQLAKIENADLADVMNVVTTSLNDFHMPADKAADIAAKLREAAGAAKTNLDAFAGSLHSVEPIASMAHVPLEQIYAATARLTQSGMGAAQGTENLASAIRNFMAPSQTMRDGLGKIGLSASQLQTELGDPNVGIVGVLQQVSNAINSHVGPSGKVAISTFYQNADAVGALKTAYEALSPSSKAMADQLNAGTVKFKDLRQAAVIDPALKNWMTMRQTVDGLSSNLKHLQPDLETVQQLWKEVTGGKETFNIAAQLVGSPEAVKQLTDLLQKLGAAVPTPNGNVPGFDQTMESYKAKLAQFKDSWDAARIELGEAFLPTMTHIVGILKEGTQWLSQHKGVMEGVVITVGALSTAYLGLKGALAIKKLIDDLEKSFFRVNTAAATANETIAATGPAATKGAAEVEAATTAEVAAEDRVTVAAEQAGGALGRAGGLIRGLGSVAAPLAAGYAVPRVNDFLNHQDWFHEMTTGGSWWNNPLGHGLGAFMNVQNFLGEQSGLYTPGHAKGGSIDGSGPKGKDSVPAWLAPGEHVLTADEVDAMGGQDAVYAFRHAIRRAGGGEVGPDVMAAMSMVGTPYSQGARNDCSGMVGRVVEAATGMGGGLPTTQNMAEWLAARGFVPGIGGPGTISVGWYNHGNAPNDGHTAMTLSDGENAESGGSHGNFIVGGNVGASSSQFDHHMYLPNLYGEGMGGSGAGGMGGLGGGGGFGGMGGGGGMPAGSTPGTGPGGQPGYYTPNQQKVGHAQEEVTHLQNEIKTLEERKAGLKADATQAQRDQLEEQLRHDHELLDEAHDRLEKAQQGDFHAGGGGGAGGGSDSKYQSMAQQLGSGLLTGLMSDLGFGNVLGGKSPLDFTALKGAAGIANFGIGLANQWANNRLSGRPDMEGLPGAGIPGIGGGAPDAGEGGAPHFGTGAPPGPTGVEPGGVPAGGGAPAAPSHGWWPTPNTPAPSQGWWPAGPPPPRGLAPPNVSGWTRPAPGAGQMPTLGRAAGSPPSPNAGAGSLIAPGISTSTYVPGFTAHYASGGAVDPLDPNAGSGWWGFAPDTAGGDSMGVGGQPGGGQLGDMLSGLMDLNLPKLAMAAQKPAVPNPAPAGQVQGHAGGGIIGYFAGGGWIPAGFDADGHPVYGVRSGATTYVPFGADAQTMPKPRVPWANGPHPNSDPGMGVNLNDRAKRDLGGVLGSGSPGNDSANFGMYTGGPNVKRAFATGGPSGTDTVPAWLSPGEFVMTRSAVNKYGSGFMSAVNAGKYSSGGTVALAPSSVSSVPTATAVHSSGNHINHAPVTYDNRIIVQGNSLADAEQLVRPMQEQMNARTYSRSQFGGLPMSVGPGGG